MTRYIRPSKEVNIKGIGDEQEVAMDDIIILNFFKKFCCLSLS